MSEENFLIEAQLLFEQLSNAQTDDFLELLKIAQLDPMQDLAGQDLAGLSLCNIYLAGANRTRVDLSEANLISTDLSGANLSGANLSGSDLSGANLSGANLSGANLSNAIFRMANLNNSNLTQVMLQGGNFDKAILTGACIKDWAKNSSVSFQNIEADYIYLNYLENNESGILEFSDRYPKTREFSLAEAARFFEEILGKSDITQDLTERKISESLDNFSSLLSREKYSSSAAAELAYGYSEEELLLAIRETMHSDKQFKQRLEIAIQSKNRQGLKALISHVARVIFGAILARVINLVIANLLQDVE